MKSRIDLLLHDEDGTVDEDIGCISFDVKDSMKKEVNG